MKKKSLIIALTVALVFAAVLVPAVSATYTPPTGVFLGSIEIHVTPDNDSDIYIDSVSDSGHIGFYHGVTTIDATLGTHTIYSVFTDGSTVSTRVNVAESGTTYKATITKPTEEKGYIDITSSPSNASVYIDGNYAGKTPGSFSVKANITHRITVQKSGYETWASRINVSTGQTQDLSAVLTPSVSNGYLTVTSTPNYCDVYVDGGYKGQTPLTVSLYPGSHTLELTKGGYTTFKYSVSIKEGVTSTVSAVLVKEETSGYITVSSTPRGASVYVDGSYVGLTPTNGALSYTVTANTTHTLRLKASGYNDWTTSFSVPTGQFVSFSPELTIATPTTSHLYVTSSPSNANVYIDGVFAGTTPFTYSDLSAGAHTVKVSSLGYNDYVTTVNVIGGQPCDVLATLTPSSQPQPTSSPFPVMGLLIGLGAAAIFVGRKLRH